MNRESLHWADKVVGKPMKKYFVSAFLMISTITCAAADMVGMDSVPVIQADEATPAMPVEGRWGGAYAGLSLGGGRLWDSLNATGQNHIEGGFVGYNIQMGSFVSGVEASLDHADITFTDGSNVKSSVFFSGRLRAGFATDKLYAYGSFGVQHSTSKNFFGSKDTALQLGAGVDYALTSNVVLGADYTHSFYKNFSNTGIDVSIQRLQARISYLFN